MQFAEWIVELHNQPCHVVYTDFRPTPLQHYMFPEGGDGMYLVVDEKSVFREDNFQKAMGSLAEMQGEDPSDPNSGKGRKGKTKKGAMKGGSKVALEVLHHLTLWARRRLGHLQTGQDDHGEKPQPGHHLCLFQARVRGIGSANVQTRHEHRGRSQDGGKHL